MKVSVLDHGYIEIHNMSGPTRRADQKFDAHDRDPAQSARMSFDQSDVNRAVEEDFKLNRYLMSHFHTTPIEMIEVWIEMKMPIFVARQFVRHRTVSINEISGRYVKLPKEWYIPRLTDVTLKSQSNKQGRTDVQHEMAEQFCYRLNEDCKRSYAQYEWSIDNEIPLELARCFLHVNHYTKWLWKQDLHNLMHYLALREDNHAQKEAQYYALAIKSQLQVQLPNLMSLYNDYRRMK